MGGMLVGLPPSSRLPVIPSAAAVSIAAPILSFCEIFPRRYRLRGDGLQLKCSTVVTVMGTRSLGGMQEGVRMLKSCYGQRAKKEGGKKSVLAKPSQGWWLSPYAQTFSSVKCYLYS